MPRYKIVEKIDTYATTEIEARTPVAALELARDDWCEWDYDTDYDSAKTIIIEEIK